MSDAGGGRKRSIDDLLDPVRGIRSVRVEGVSPEKGWYHGLGRPVGGGRDRQLTLTLTLALTQTLA